MRAPGQMRVSVRTLALALLAVFGTAGAGARARSEEKKSPLSPRAAKAIASGIAALASAQTTTGCFGEVTGYPVAITSMAGLALLAAEDDPLEDPVAQKAYRYLLEKQSDGSWPQEGSTWVHVQGFATLFMAEVYGKVLLAPDPKLVPALFEKAKLKALVTRAVALLAEAQSTSGGWYYTRNPTGDEGSTTVCAVQALRAAKNFGIPVEPQVLAKGFAYLKAMQNPDGGFRYMGPQGPSMISGTAAAVATLVLMQKLDEKVLFSGLKFLETIAVKGVAGGTCAEYGLFYSAMAMTVLGEEYGEHLAVAATWTKEIEEQLLALESPSGSWADSDLGGTSSGYGTSLAVLSLACPRGGLSVFHRRAPKLPVE